MSNISCGFIARNRGRERKRGGAAGREEKDSGFDSNVYTFATNVLNSAAKDEESGRNIILYQKEGKRTDKENASQLTEFNDEFLREQNSVIFPAGNTRSLPF